MSTTNLTDWAVDLAEVGAISPFQGSEGILVLVCYALWIGWHVWQLCWEKSYNEKKVQEYATAENIKKAIEDN